MSEMVANSLEKKGWNELDRDGVIGTKYGTSWRVTDEGG